MSNDPFSWMGGGLDQSPEQSLKNQEELHEKAFQERMELAQLTHRVFIDNPDGALLLAWLEENTILKPLMVLTGSFVDQEIALSPADWAYIREGQNSVVRFLQRQIELARQPQQSEQEDNG